MTRFHVNRRLMWDGVEYFPGDSVEIDDRHPNIRPLVEQTKHLSYDDRLAPVGPTTPQQIILQNEQKERAAFIAEEALRRKAREERESGSQTHQEQELIDDARQESAIQGTPYQDPELALRD